MQIKLSKPIKSLLVQEGFNQPAVRFEQAVDRIFLALLTADNNHASYILKRFLRDWELYQLRMRLEEELENGSPSTPVNVVSTSAYQVLYTALNDICNRFTYATQPTINSAHLLIYIMQQRRFASSRILEKYGIDIRKVEELTAQLPADENYYIDMNSLSRLRMLDNADNSASDNGYSQQESRHDTTAAEFEHATDGELSKFGVDLTRQAREGRIDAVVGRDVEIERLIQILSRRKKNNPVLIGQAGVGKSAVVEGLALRIASKKVPHTLDGKRIFALDVASLVAGTKYRGQFEERIKDLLSQLSEDGNTILFIDEIHTIVGAGSTQGSLDTANILKPALARGQLQCIGATTLDEYRECIEADSALERRFQKIIVEPTSPEQTLGILASIKSHYEQYHSVVYTDEALNACVDLSDRYITDRNFPDKAIDILDEAGARESIASNKKSDQISAVEISIEQTVQEKLLAIRNMAYDKAAEAGLRESALRSRFDELSAEWEQKRRQNPATVTADNIRDVVSLMTGIPLQRLTLDERERLNGMSVSLAARVVGQREAIDKVSRSVLRSRAGLKPHGRPVGVFMFVGPTGVGKTLLAKELSRQLFDRDDALVRIDMSEYSQQHNISRMIGSPPGYVGYNQGGQLTEAIRRQPYSVVLFDEIEKAHPDVFNVMLQIFDDGCLTDGLGRRVDFRNTVIIMTSNIGSRSVQSRGAMVGYATPFDVPRQTVNREKGYREALEGCFAPEFINRIDDIVLFNTLSRDDVMQIVDLELADLSVRCSKSGCTLGVSQPAREFLVEHGYDSKYGVRSLKRMVLEHIEEPLAEIIVSSAATPTVSVDVQDGRLTLTTDQVPQYAQENLPTNEAA